MNILTEHKNAVIIILIIWEIFTTALPDGFPL